MKNVAFVKAIKASILDVVGVPIALLSIWASLSFLTFPALKFLVNVLPWAFWKHGHTGMIYGVAFGQNDLANCASGLAIWMILSKGELAGKVAVPLFALFGCGVLLLGMTTRQPNA